MESSVKMVRVFLRHSVAQMSGKIHCHAAKVPDFQQRTLVHVQHAAAEFRGLGVVGDHDDALAVFAIQDLQQMQHLVGGFAVQIAGGLVAHQKLGIRDQRARDGDALRLAAGELPGLVLGAIRDADQGESRRGVCGPLRGREVREQQRKLHVPLRVQHGHQVVELEHEADVLARQRGAAPAV